MAPPTLATAQWSPDGADWVLRGTGTNGERVDLARLSDGSHLPPVHSPRPFLHPVRTARGLDLTDVTPVDHRHHYGTSLALPMVNGTSYWGGRTFLRDEGPTLLPNHGRQIVRSVAPGTEQGCLTHSVEWLTERGEHLLSEQRRLSAAPLHDGWRITWESELLADGGDLRIESPATNGRPGAGYGGLFWRLGRADTTTVLGEGAVGEETLHGSSSPWLAFVQHHGVHTTSLILVQHPAQVLPWFLRLAEYPGAGPALAWESVRTVPAGSMLNVGLSAIALDRAVTQDEAAFLANSAW